MRLLDLYQLQDCDCVTCKIRDEILILLYFFKFSNPLYILYINIYMHIYIYIGFSTMLDKGLRKNI